MPVWITPIRIFSCSVFSFQRVGVRTAKLNIDSCQTTASRRQNTARNLHKPPDEAAKRIQRTPVGSLLAGQIGVVLHNFPLLLHAEDTKRRSRRKGQRSVEHTRRLEQHSRTLLSGGSPAHPYRILANLRLAETTGGRQGHIIIQNDVKSSPQQGTHSLSIQTSCSLARPQVLLLRSKDSNDKSPHQQ